VGSLMWSDNTWLERKARWTFVEDAYAAANPIFEPPPADDTHAGLGRD
jgi:hypothetical protein